MRKVITILLLSVLLFNIGGYCILFSYLEKQANSQLEQKLDEGDYNASQLVAFKMPLSTLPYYTNSNDFERKDGQVEINGKLMHYVKLRIYNDTLEVYCIPEPDIAQLKTARDDFFKLAGNLEQAGHSKKGGSSAELLKLFSVHYTLHHTMVLPGCYTSTRQTGVFTQYLIPVDFNGSIDIPPERC